MSFASSRDSVGPGASGRPQHSFLSFLVTSSWSGHFPSYHPLSGRSHFFRAPKSRPLLVLQTRNTRLSPHSANVVYVPRPPFLTEYPHCLYSKSRFHSPQPTTVGLIYPVLSCSPVRRCRTFPGPAHWLLQYWSSFQCLQEGFNSPSASPPARESLLSISLALSPTPLQRRFTELFCHTWLSKHLSPPELTLQYSWNT